MIGVGVFVLDNSDVVILVILVTVIWVVLVGSLMVISIVVSASCAEDV